MPHDVHERDLYRWRGDDEQRRLYPYVKDDEDVAAFDAYARRGFLPPQRPDGFLDDEEQAWARWRTSVHQRKLDGVGDYGESAKSGLTD